jgi:hypothetical protein
MPPFLRTLAIASFITALGAPTLHAQTPQPVTDTIALRLAKELIRVAAVDSSMMRGMEHTMNLQRSLGNSNVPKEFYDKFAAAARKDLPDLVNEAATIYATRFSVAELNGLIEFF